MSGYQGLNEFLQPSEGGKDCIAILARDPFWLYVYWDISENKKNLLEQDFGSEIVKKSSLVLKISNLNKNESFFVRINEFSSSWYVKVPDANSNYSAEIGRRISDDFFISILSSNIVTTPGDTVSKNTSAYFINYSDFREDIKSLKFHETVNPDKVTDVKQTIDTVSSQEFIKTHHVS